METRSSAGGRTHTGSHRPPHRPRLAIRELPYEDTPLGRLYDRAALERRRAQPPAVAARYATAGSPVRPEPAALVERTTPVVINETATLLDERGQPVAVFQAGRAYLVSEEVARLLVDGGHAQQIG